MKQENKNGKLFINSKPQTDKYLVNITLDLTGTVYILAIYQDGVLIYSEPYNHNVFIKDANTVVINSDKFYGEFNATNTSDFTTAEQFNDALMGNIFA
jgi:hypothetical protein